MTIEVPAAEVPVTSEPSEAERLSSTTARGPERRTTASGLIVEEIAIGNGAEAGPGQRVRLHYVGTIPDGTVFDSTRERGTPFEVELGKGYLIRGFEEGVAGMRVGGTRRLIIPPDLGYGSRTVHGKIPANATLEFEVELLEVVPLP